MKHTITIILLGLPLCAPALSQQTTKRLGEHETRLSAAVKDCSVGAACKTFKQMVQAKDETVLEANWACFYSGHNPAEKNSTPSTDAFFLLQNGAGHIMKNEKHPGIFVNLVEDGLPDEWRGFGPEHGGLDEENQGKINPDGKEVFVSTYDELNTSIRWARFQYVPLRDDPPDVYRRLRYYDETEMRKSTGRFIRKITDFGSSFEPTTYAGQCLELK